MLYRQSVNKLMRRARFSRPLARACTAARPPVLSRPRELARHSGSGLMSRPGIYALKSLILIHPPRGGSPRFGISEQTDDCFF